MVDALIVAGFLAGAALLVTNIVQVWLGRQRIRCQLQELEEIRQGELLRQQRMIELSRLNASRQFEVQWLTSTSPGRDQLDRLFHLLDDRTSGDVTACSWMFAADGTLLGSNRAAANLGEAPQLLHVGGTPLSQVTCTGTAALASDFHWAGKNPLPEQSQLLIFPCAPLSPRRSYLALSVLPDVTGDSTQDRDLLAELCRRFVIDPGTSHEEIVASAEELDLVRDMLTLRSLTDNDFATPATMLQEFLSRLAYLTDFERGSLYRWGDGEELLSSGGIAVDRHEDHLWRLHELQLLRSFGSNASPAGWINDCSQMSSTNWTGTALIAVDRSAGRPSTFLLLSSRSPVTRHRVKEELASWSVQFLPQAFEKALVRVQNEERARRDALTRLANRHTFDAELHKAITACHANQLPCSLLLIDIDHFKSINDTHGHLAGDAVLRSVAQILSQGVQQTRVTDRSLVARFGGEEFAVILPEIPMSGAARIAEQLRLLLAAAEIRFDGGPGTTATPISVTASIGVATTSSSGAAPLSLVAAADEALYEAKHSGRNRVELANSRQRLSLISTAS